MPCDQHRVEVAAALRDDADRLDHRHLVGGERTQEPVFPPRQLDGQLLQGIELRVRAALVLDETHDVAVDAADDLDQPLVPPLLERLVPGKVEKIGMPRPRDQLQPGRHLSQP